MTDTTTPDTGTALTVLEGMQVYNETDIDDAELREASELREVAMYMNRFVKSAQRTHETGMFDRKAYSPPAHVYDERAAAQHAAAYDDVVGAGVDAHAALIFRGVKIEVENPIEQEIWNKYAADINLDRVFRNAAREKKINSEVDFLRDYVRRSYKTTKVHGNSARSRFEFLAPDIRILNCQHIVPFDLTPARASDRLAWYANEQSVRWYHSARKQERVDPRMMDYYLDFVNQDTLFDDELDALNNLGVDPTRLIELNPYFVFRDTDDKPDYARHADVRLKRLFALLDLKQQQIAKDRAHLIGGANYILILRKGSEKHPGTPQEREDLKRNYKYIAKQPVIISDHRLDVSLVAPPQEFVLDPDRYEAVNLQIAAAFWGIFGSPKIPGAMKANVAMMAANLERDRSNLKRTFEREVLKKIVDHPLNAGVFTEEPRIVFHPRNVEIEKDPATLQALMSLYEKRGFPLTSLLEQMGFDISVEAQHKRNDALYAAEFPEYMPYDYQNTPGTPAETPAASGARGGRPAGKKAAPGKVQNVTENGHPSTKKVA